MVRHKGGNLGDRLNEPDPAQRAVRLLLAALLVLPQAVVPATITVTGTDSSTTAGNGVCSLREAIDNANGDNDTSGTDCAKGFGADTVELTADVTLTLVDHYDSFGSGVNRRRGLPRIATDITIEGGGFTIARDSGAPTFGIFEVVSGGTLNLNNTTVSGGYNRFGGGIGNRNGTLTLTNSTLSGNTGKRVASAHGYGGGIMSQSGGSVTLINSTLSGNYAGFRGGGIETQSSGLLTLINSTVSGNSIVNSSGRGGGIKSYSPLTLTNSTVSGNSAGYRGGGLDTTSTATLTNSTVSGNSANNRGGGIYATASSTLTLTNSTLSGNTAGIGDNIFGGNTTLTRSIVVGGTCALNSSGDGGNNFTESSTCPGAAITNGTHIETSLADNGGPTQTHALLTGSPAIDAAGSCGLTTDQRGAPRLAGFCDSGSYEFGSSPPGSGTDTDGDGDPDSSDPDDDNDGVLDGPDTDSLDPDVCEDADGDDCDDCSVGTDDFGPMADNTPANDGTDTDGDGLCDLGDPDDDNDGVLDGPDTSDLNPDVCADADADTCDDCAIGTDDFGAMADNTPANDGTDTDGDGSCDAGDVDDDNDGVADGPDTDSLDPDVCADADGDDCDDCAVGTDDFGPMADNTPANDGTDTDGDGSCDFGDPDDDNDGVLDGPDTSDLDPDVCEDADGDDCDDCSVGTDDFGPMADNTPANDGTDTDGDGSCDFGDPDDDNDGVLDGADTNTLNPDICEDVDADTCDDCAIGTDDFGAMADNTPANDGTDEDSDGICNAGDLCLGTAPAAPIDDKGCSDGQVDGDGDGICDPGAPSDGPSMCTGSDNCPVDPNPGQDDGDGDGVGDVCDDDDDNDGVDDDSDCDALDPEVNCHCTDLGSKDATVPAGIFIGMRGFIADIDVSEFVTPKKKDRMVRYARAAERNCERGDCRDVWALMDRIAFLTDGDGQPTQADFLPDAAPSKAALNARAIKVRDTYGALAGGVCPLGLSLGDQARRDPDGDGVPSPQDCAPHDARVRCDCEDIGSPNSTIGLLGLVESLPGDLFPSGGRSRLRRRVEAAYESCLAGDLAGTVRRLERTTVRDDRAGAPTGLDLMPNGPEKKMIQKRTVALRDGYAGSVSSATERRIRRPEEEK